MEEDSYASQTDQLAGDPTELKERSPSEELTVFGVEAHELTGDQVRLVVAVACRKEEETPGFTFLPARAGFEDGFVFEDLGPMVLGEFKLALQLQPWSLRELILRVPREELDRALDVGLDSYLKEE